MNTPITANDRATKNLDAFIAPDPRIDKLTLRPFSAGTLTLCRALGLTLLCREGAATDTSISPEEKQRQLTTFLFIQSQPIDVVKRAVQLARRDRQAFEDEYLLPFELELPVSAIFTVMRQLEESLGGIEAAQVEVLSRPDSRGSDTPSTPPN